MTEVVNYCPECRLEYREGFFTCSDCDVPLVRRLESDAGAGDGLVPLAREAFFDFVADLVDHLENHGIPYVVQAGTALPLLDGASAAKIEKPQPWEARIWVTRAHEQRAREIHEELVGEWRRTRSTELANRHFDFTGAKP